MNLIDETKQQNRALNNSSTDSATNNDNNPYLDFKLANKSLALKQAIQQNPEMQQQNNQQ